MNASAGIRRSIRSLSDDLYCSRQNTSPILKRRGDASQKLPRGIALPLLLFRQLCVRAEHGMLSCGIIPGGAVAPVIKCIKTEPPHMVQPAVHILHRLVSLCFTVCTIRFFHRPGGQLRDRLVFEQDADLHQYMVCRGDLGLPVEVIQLLPAIGRIRNRAAEKLIDHDRRLVQSCPHDLIRSVDFFICTKIGDSGSLPAAVQVDLSANPVIPVQSPEYIPPLRLVIRTDDDAVRPLQKFMICFTGVVMEDKRITWDPQKYDRPRADPQK